MGYLRLQTKPFNLSIINVWAQLENSAEEEKLEEVVELLRKNDTVTILRNFNAQAAKKNTESANMILSKSNHPKKHKATWLSPDQKTYTKLDHILNTKRKQYNIKDVRT